MKYKLLSAILIVLVIAAGIIWQIQRQKNSESPRDAGNSEKLNVSGSVPEPPRQEAVKPHPVSLPALMQKKYDGRELVLGKVLEENSAYIRYFITYKSGNLTISGIMNVPKGTGPFPVLILNHGYIDPAVYTNGRGLRREQDYLARKGYVVLHSDYRGHAQSDNDPDADLNFRLGYAEDVINAVQAVRASDFAFINKEKIGMLGHSMGGGVSINILVAQPKLVDAIVLFAPVSADAVDNFQRWTERRPELAKRVVDTYGTAESNPEFWKNIFCSEFFGQSCRSGANSPRHGG